MSDANQRKQVMFGPINITFIDMPHLLVWRFDSHIVDKWCHIVGDTPGIWGWGVLPYDANEGANEGWSYTDAPFLYWELEQNQIALRQACNSLDLSDNFGVIVNCRLPEDLLSQYLGRSLADEEYSQEFWNRLPMLITDLSSWALVPLGADADACVCIACPKLRSAIENLRRWCIESSIKCSTLSLAANRFLWNDYN